MRKIDRLALNLFVLVSAISCGIFCDSDTYTIEGSFELGERVDADECVATRFPMFSSPDLRIEVDRENNLVKFYYHQDEDEILEIWDFDEVFTVSDRPDNCD